MADYFSLLTRTIAALDCKGPDDRRVVYERARQALADHLYAREPPPSELAIRTEQALLETAIRRAEATAARNDPPHLRPPPPPPREPPPAARPRDLPPEDAAAAPDLDAILEPDRSAFSRPMVIALAAAAAVLVALAAFALWTRPSGEATPPPASRAPAQPPVASETAPAQTTEVRPDAADGLPYVYRRQPVFYRTTNPVGTIIVDKSQRLLYLVQPNVSALRYGIGVGRGCLDVAGLLRVTRKEEPSDGAKALGARVIYLSNETQLIHGTDATKNIGGAVPQGCFLLVNDAVIDLFERVQVGAGVVVTD
jgi:lipoprotein-anchoring transpeptidase ErfK/SrfK